MGKDNYDIEQVIINKIKKEDDPAAIDKLLDSLSKAQKINNSKNSRIKLASLIFDYIITIGLISSGVYFSFVVESQFGIALLILGLGKAGIDTKILRKLRNDA